MKKIMDGPTVGTPDKGILGHVNPPKGKGYTLMEGNETAYFDEKTRPGPVVSNPVRRGRRISRMRRANDAAQAIRQHMIQSLKEYSGA